MLPIAAGKSEKSVTVYALPGVWVIKIFGRHILPLSMDLEIMYKYT